MSDRIDPLGQRQLFLDDVAVQSQSGLRADAASAGQIRSRSQTRPLAWRTGRTGRLAEGVSIEIPSGE